jgi:hypothetical protein
LRHRLADEFSEFALGGETFGLAFGSCCSGGSSPGSPKQIHALGRVLGAWFLRTGPSKIESRVALLSTSLLNHPIRRGSMARSKSKQKVKRHRHKLRRNRALARKKAAKAAKD